MDSFSSEDAAFSAGGGFAAHAPAEPLRDGEDDPMPVFEEIRARLAARAVRIRASDWLRSLDDDDSDG